MSESNLGTAVLSLRVETGPALAALKAFRAQVESSLGTADTSGLFKGVENDARAAGEKAGKALADGVKKQTKELKFGSFQQALDFTPKNSIKGLEEYARALRNLRDRTDLTAAGTQQLTDRLGAVEAALRQARRTTAETTAEQRRFNEALERATLQRFSEQARSFAANLREQARAAAANAEQFRKIREQAEGAAKAVAGLAAKGVGEALKVPIFGLPKDVTGTFDKARAQIERLKQQAETASGKVARLSEGVAVLGAGGVAAKGVVDVLGGIGGAAAETTGILNQVQQALSSLPGPLKGLGGLDEVFSNGAQAVANWATSILQAQGELSTLAVPLEAVTSSLSALGPEAVAVGGALAFTFAGFQDLIAQSFKPGVDGARAALKGITADTQALLEALARVSDAASGLASLGDLRVAEKDAAARVQAAPAGTEENIQATKELLEIQRRIRSELQAQFLQEQSLLLTEKERAEIARQLQTAAQASSQLALPSSEILNAEGRGIRRLTPDQGPAIDVGLQNARNYTQELVRAGQAADQLPGIFAVVNQSLRGLVDTTAEQTLGLRVQRELLEDQLALQNQLRVIEAERSKEARARNRDAVENSPERQRIRQENDLLAVQNKRRAAQTKERQRQISEASSNALIGGAFPALFGQGLGASVGGALGGGAGGLVGGQFGFGLSLLGTALGGQFDVATQKLQTLGSALSDPVAQFSALGEAGLISSKSLEKQVQALIDTGREAEAAALIQKDLASSYGDLQSAKELAAASDELGRSWAQLQIAAVQLSAEPIADLLSSTASGLTLFADAIKNLKALLPQSVVRLFNPINALVPGSTLAQGAGGGGQRGKSASSQALAQDNQLLAAAKQNYSELNILAFRQAAAQAQGNKELELSLRKRQLELELQRSTATLNESNDPGGTKRQSFTDKAKQEIFALGEQLRALRNGSLTDLQEQLSRLNSQRLSVPVDSQQFAQLGSQIDTLKTRIDELQRTPLRLDSIAGLQQQISDLEARQIKLSVDSSAFTAANQQILQTQNALEQLDGKKAIITVEQINAGVQDGSLTNNFSNLEKRSQAAQQALNSAAFGSPEFQQALRAAQSASFELDQRRKAADPNAFSKALEDAKKAQEDAAQGVKDAFKNAEQAAESLAQAQNNFRSALEGSFDLLTSGRQTDLLNASRNDLQRAVNAGFFDSGKVAKLTDKELVGAAAQARAVIDASDKLNGNQSKLINSNIALEKATANLVQKNWAVNVAVNANTGDYAVNLG